jgi:hypothetical protein
MINWVFQKPKEMNFILYIKCTQEQGFSYSNPFYETLKKEISNADFLDLDNFSGQELIDMAESAIKKSSKTSVVFDLGSENVSRKFIKLATFLADEPKGKMVFINGIDDIIYKLLPAQENFCYHNIPMDEQIKKINEFIKV